MKTISFLGNGSYSNRGCEAIVRGTTNLFYEELGDCRFISSYFQVDGCNDQKLEIDHSIIHQPFPIQKRFSPRWIEGKIKEKFFSEPAALSGVKTTLAKSLLNADLALMLGGDNYTLDYHRPDVYFRINQEVIKRGIPCVLWGASIGPFSALPEYEAWAVKELKKVNLICVRETISQGYLDNLGIQKNVLLMVDPSFYMSTEEIPLSDDVEKFLCQDCIGINLSPLIATTSRTTGNWQEDYEKWLIVATEWIERISGQCQLPILLIPHVTSETSDMKRDDRIFLSKIEQKLGRKDQILLLKEDLNAAQLKYVISRTKIFLGARAHSTFAAISTCVPTICIGYSQKAQGVSQDVYGNNDWLIDTKSTVDPSEVASKVTALYQSRKEIKQMLSSKLPHFKALARNAVQKIDETFLKND